MLKRITSTVFYAGVVIMSVGAAIWLTLTGHTLYTGGLLMALGAVLAAVLFGFRLAEGFGPDRLSIWSGRVLPHLPSTPTSADGDHGLGKAA